MPHTKDKSIEGMKEKAREEFNKEFAHITKDWGYIKTVVVDTEVESIHNFIDTLIDRTYDKGYEDGYNEGKDHYELHS